MGALIAWLAENRWVVKIAGAALALAALGAALYGLYLHGYHKGHETGVAERNAYYGPLFEAAKEGLAAATARTQQHDAASAAIVNDLKARYEKNAALLASRADAADQRIARILREHASCPAPSASAVPGVPATADARPSAGKGHDAAPPGGPRSRLARDAGQCEHDADELGVWLDWYARQRELIGAKP